MNLPQGWIEIKIGDMAQYINGKAFKPSEWEDSGLQIVRIQNLNDDNAKYNYSSKIIEDKYKIRKGDLLFAWSASLGAFIWLGKDAWLNQHIFKVVPYNGVDRNFLYYVLVNTASLFYSKTHGSGMVHITKEPFESTKAILPPFSEQQRIVAKIDSLFSELENGVTMLKTIKAQLAIYRQAVLKWAFEGKLTKEWRKQNSVSDWKYVNIEKYLIKTDKSMSTGPFGTMLKKHEHKISGVPVLGIENIGNGNFIHGNKIFVTSEKAKFLKSFVLHTNDVIISRSGTVGELCLVPQELDGSLMSTNLIRVTLDENVIIPKFFVFLFQSKGIVIDQVKELCKGSTRAFLNQTILKKILFPFLSIDEQRQIIDAIESRLSVCDKLEQTIDQTLALSASLRQSILKKAFEGRLVPQDPNDEPAEKLLERIKAEKAAVLAKQKQTRKRGKK